MAGSNAAAREQNVGGLTYERDTVITFVCGQYYRPTKARNDEADIFFAANLNQAEELSYGSQGILLPFWKT
ncbi:hypothetical protein [Paenibacillus sp. PSB04]|uniref:hypothetical protein n=1 Tax=Paenibacillus sp. PSB04 TaxID=2866810 RepID=UPI0039A2B9C2